MGFENQKLNAVTPLKTGVQKLLKELDSGLRRNDKLWTLRFCVLKTGCSAAAGRFEYLSQTKV